MRRRALLVWLALASFASAEVRMLHEPLLDRGVCTMQLYHLASSIEHNQTFNVARTLRDYYDAFGAPFIRALKTLGPEDTWLDSGSGSGYAQAEYQAGHDISRERVNRFGRNPFPVLEGLPRGKTTGVTVSLPVAGAKVLETLDREGHSARHRSLVGRYLEDIPTAELGTTKLITDLFGPLAYSTDPSAVMNRYLEAASPSATIFIVLKEAATFVKGKDGLSYSLEDYLRKSLTGHEVEFLAAGEPMRIQLSPGGARKIPRLKLVELREGSPPFRIFEEVAE